MEIIILILIALGKLSSPTQFNDAYINTHQLEISKAEAIYNNNLYTEADGGVIIDDTVNP